MVTENRNRSFTFHVIIHLPFAPACPPSNRVVTEAQTTISPCTKVMILFLSVAKTRSLFFTTRTLCYNSVNTPRQRISEACQVLTANTFNQIHENFASCSFIDGQVQDMLPSTTSGRSHAPPLLRESAKLHRSFPVPAQTSRPAGKRNLRHSLNRSNVKHCDMDNQVRRKALRPNQN